MSDPKIDYVNQVDSRVLQDKSIRYPIVRSNTSVANVVAQATSASQALLSFTTPNINPSVIIDRRIRIRANLYFQGTITVGGTAIPNSAIDTVVVRPNVDFVPCSFPLHEAMGSISLLINDLEVINLPMGEAKDIMQRMCDYRANMRMQTGPSCPDLLARYSDGWLTNLNALSNINDVDFMSGFTGNGAWQMQMAGVNISTGNVGAFSTDALTWRSFASVSSTTPTDAMIGANTVCTFQIKLSCNEILMCPPFLFNLYDIEREPGLTGVKNFSLNIVMNSGSRCIRNTGQSTFVTGAAAILSPNIVFLSSNPFGNDNTGQNAPSIYYTLIDKPISSSIDTLLKPVYRMPYLTRQNFPAYGLAPGATGTYTTQQMNLTRVPDYIILGVRPQQINIPSDYGDYLYQLNPTVNPLNITWNSVNGKCATMSKRDIYEMSRRNGLQDQYLLWSGEPATRFVSSDSSGTQVPTIGGWIICRAGIDFSIAVDESNSATGMFNLTVSLNVVNQTLDDQRTKQVNFCVYFLYNDIYEIDAVNNTGTKLANLVTPEIIYNTDEKKPVKTDIELSDGIVGGSLFGKMARHSRSLVDSRRPDSYSVTAAEMGGKMTAGALSGGAASRRRRF